METIKEFEHKESVENFLSCQKKIRKKIKRLLINDLARNPNFNHDFMQLIRYHNESASYIKEFMDFIDYFQLKPMVLTMFVDWETLMEKTDLISKCPDADGNVYPHLLNRLAEDIRKYNASSSQLEEEINTYYFLYMNS